MCVCVCVGFVCVCNNYDNQKNQTTNHKHKKRDWSDNIENKDEIIKDKHTENNDNNDKCDNDNDNHRMTQEPQLGYNDNINTAQKLLENMQQIAGQTKNLENIIAGETTQIMSDNDYILISNVCVCVCVCVCIWFFFYLFFCSKRNVIACVSVCVCFWCIVLRKCE